MAIRRFSSSNLSGGKSSKLWDQTTTPGYYESIATFVVDASGYTAIDFNNIPQNYAHLQVRFLIKSSGANNDFSIGMNGSFSIANSSTHHVVGNGTSATSASYTSQNYVSLTNVGSLTGAVPSGSYAAGIIDILDYTSTSKTKTIRTLWGSDQNGAGIVALNSGSLNSTSAMTSLNLYNGYSWGQYSTFALYGIRGA